MKNRGSILGFKQIIHIILNAQLSTNPNNEDYILAMNQLGFLDINYNYDSGEILLYFPKKIEYSENLFNYIRPIGMYIKLIEVEIPEPESDIAVNTTVETNIHREFKPYVVRNNEKNVIESDESYRINKSLVNLSQIGRLKDLELLTKKDITNDGENNE